MLPGWTTLFVATKLNCIVWCARLNYIAWCYQAQYHRLFIPGLNTMFDTISLNYTILCYPAELHWLNLTVWSLMFSGWIPIVGILPVCITMFDVARLNYKQNFLFPKSFKLGTMPENCSLKQSLSKKQRNDCVRMNFAGKSNPLYKTFWIKLQRIRHGKTLKVYTI